MHSPHTHTFNGPLSGTTRVSQYQKGKINLDFSEARDSEWQWHQLGYIQVCTSLQTDNHASTPPLHWEEKQNKIRGKEGAKKKKGRKGKGKRGNGREENGKSKGGKGRKETKWGRPLHWKGKNEVKKSIFEIREVGAYRCHVLVVTQTKTSNTTNSNILSHIIATL